jgi:O-antigen/teichoic acid export membrane protein
MPYSRIARNTATTYLRSLVAAGLSLVASRWVLHAMGHTDYGIYSITGTLALFVAFINNVLAGSTARYLAFSIGHGDRDELKKWFNAAVSIHLSLAFILVITGWPLGEYAVRHVLSLPADRVESCIIVFRLSLLSSFVSMAAVPFFAVYTARQQLQELAAWGILNSCFTFVLALILHYVGGDVLVFYATWMAAIVVCFQSVQVVRAIRLFDECDMIWRQWFDVHRIWRMVSFSLWNMIGSTGVLLRDQGSAILLNLNFGPGINAAYGIASQVSAQTNQMSAAMLGSFAPEIISSEGRGDRERLCKLTLSACKFGSLMVLVFALPLMLEMDTILTLWLQQPPQYTAPFCQIILATFLIDRLSAGYTQAVMAKGKMAAYQATLGTCLLLTLPLAWLMLKFGGAPPAIGYAFIITMSLTSMGRVAWGRYLFGITYKSWLRTVVVPFLSVGSGAMACALIPRLLLPPTAFRCSLVIITTLSSSLLLIWHRALTEGERELLQQYVFKFRQLFSA